MKELKSIFTYFNKLIPASKRDDLLVTIENVDIDEENSFILFQVDLKGYSLYYKLKNKDIFKEIGIAKFKYKELSKIFKKIKVKSTISLCNIESSWIFNIDDEDFVIKQVDMKSNGYIGFDADFRIDKENLNEVLNITHNAKIKSNRDIFNYLYLLNNGTSLNVLYMNEVFLYSNNINLIESFRTKDALAIPYNSISILSKWLDNTWLGEDIDRIISIMNFNDKLFLESEKFGIELSDINSKEKEIFNKVEKLINQKYKFLIQDYELNLSLLDEIVSDCRNEDIINFKKYFNLEQSLLFNSKYLNSILRGFFAYFQVSFNLSIVDNATKPVLITKEKEGFTSYMILTSLEEV